MLRNSRSFSKSFFIASRSSGPVLIDITKNAQLQLFEYPGYTKCNHFEVIVPSQLFRNEYIEQAAKIINEAKKPFVIFGQGVILGKAEKDFQNLLKKEIFRLHGLLWGRVQFLPIIRYSWYVGNAW
jgi:acetolactate synthase-1/2/3 large subunit